MAEGVLKQKEKWGDGYKVDSKLRLPGTVQCWSGPKEQIREA